MSGLELTVRVVAKAMLTPAICRFELEAADGGALPPFTPGAHINVRVPDGPTRSYSLTDVSSSERADRYAIAVHRKADGRGGSVGLVDGTAVGDPLDVGAPSNAFELLPAKHHLLIAGGVGITPIRAMFHQLLAEGGDVRLLYLTRSEADTAFLGEFTDPAVTDRVMLHHSGSAGRVDLWPHLAEPDDSTRVYCCGPASLMNEVRALTMHWRPSLVHFEDFAGVDAIGAGRPFTATWAPTGQSVDVGAGQTMLDALRERDIAVPGSCLSGTCGTCRVRLVSGVPEHRDLVLSEEERSDFLMPCVSRAADDAITVGPAG